MAMITPPRWEKTEIGVINLLHTMSIIQGGAPRISQKTEMRIRNGFARNIPTASKRFEIWQAHRICSGVFATTTYSTNRAAKKLRGRSPSRRNPTFRQGSFKEVSSEPIAWFPIKKFYKIV